MRIGVLHIACLVGTQLVDLPDDCSLMCEYDPNCNQVKGSYCKRGQIPELCYGYYFTSEAKDYVYIHSHGDTRRSDLPVLCTDATDILGVDFEDLEHTEDKDYCTQLCSLDSTCRDGKHGAYLKDSRNPNRQVCFGYYLKSPGSNEFMYFYNGTYQRNYPMYNEDAQRIANILQSQ